MRKEEKTKQLSTGSLSLKYGSFTLPNGACNFYLVSLMTDIYRDIKIETKLWVMRLQKTNDL
jgi:hypothetical protein